MRKLIAVLLAVLQFVLLVGVTLKRPYDQKKEARFFAEALDKGVRVTLDVDRFEVFLAPDGDWRVTQIAVCDYDWWGRDDYGVIRETEDGIVYEGTDYGELPAPTKDPTCFKWDSLYRAEFEHALGIPAELGEKYFLRHRPDNGSTWYYVKNGSGWFGQHPFPGKKPVYVEAVIYKTEVRFVSITVAGETVEFRPVSSWTWEDEVT